jgi:fido (protein-threonine AMPylation protein)
MVSNHIYKVFGYLSNKQMLTLRSELFCKGDHKITNFIYVDIYYISMYIEKRKLKNGVKYYLVHSHRNELNKVEKTRKFLGINLTQEEINKKSKEAEKIIKASLIDIKTAIFEFSLTKRQIESLNKFNNNIKITHFDKKQWELFTEDFVFNTNAIEGSTVLREEVHNILNKKNVTDNEEIETKGVAIAVDYIRKTKEDFSIKLMLKLHKLCFEGSKDFAGKFRKVEVVIRDRSGNIIHSGTLVENLDKELKELVEWYKNNKEKFKPLVLAAIIHNEFEDIHPFQDGNGRVGRLLLNYILIKNNYPPINILLEDRMQYYITLQEYQKNNKLRPSLQFLLKQYKKTLKQVTTKKKK